MIKKFYTKVDAFSVILFVFSLLYPVIIAISLKDYKILIVLFFLILFIVYLFYDTNYTIYKNNLKIRSGFFVNENIDINSIKTIRKTGSILSAPALSITGRIEIFYESAKTITISPKNDKVFFAELLKVNPNINIEI